jgi:predicted nucleotidyltransferase component of viral defense system
MIIKERIVEFRVLVILDAGIGDITLVAILDRSKSTKKVILDGVYLESDEQVDRRFLESLKLVKEACKKKKIELWKENFDAGNGKVNLEI